MSAQSEKVVWITGASSGIGLELARQYHAAGARVVLSARRAEVLHDVGASLTGPGEHMVQPIDMEQPAHFAKAVENVLARWGRVDLMVHNAGISQRSYVHETDLAVDRRIMEVNYFGTVALTKALLPHMLKQGGGHFAVVTSLVGKFGFGVRSAYAGSKHALHGFFESLHIELVHKGIRVTMICPGPVQTPISIHALDGSGHATGVMDDMQQHGMPVAKAARHMIRAIEAHRLEAVLGNFKERVGVKIHAWFPSLFFRMAVKQNPRGTVKF